MTSSWDHAVDVLVVGSGNGAMTTALSCHLMGTKDVLLVEKGDKYGGTSGISGGGIWIPNNRYAKAAGAQDSVEEARDYLYQTTPEELVPREMIDTYVEQCAEMLDFLVENTDEIRYVNLPHYPDYYPMLESGKAGNRSLEPEPIMLSELGEDGDHLSQTHAMMWALDRIALTQTDAMVVMSQLPGWKMLMAKLFWQYLSDIPWLLRHKRGRRQTNGGAGVARLRLALKKRGIPLWLKTPMEELVKDDTGRVVGAVVVKDGKPFRVHARKAVVLAAGGFERNQAMRDEYLPAPSQQEWSAGCFHNTGDAITAATKIGAGTRIMNRAWWCSTIHAPGEELPRLSIMEKSFPGSCIVGPDGKRFANESQNYMAYHEELFRKHSPETPCDPAYHIFDSRFRANFMVGPLFTSKMRPDFMLPKSYWESGFVVKADTIEELAEKIHVPAANLKDTIDQMNAYAASGKDEDFSRGDSVYDRYYADPAIKPNPCLAPIDQAPFYAMPNHPGDFGTAGGLDTNQNAQVKSTDGNVIPGLYACGNCSAAVLPTYPGPGATLGPAMTFGYLAAKAITETP